MYSVAITICYSRFTLHAIDDIADLMDDRASTWDGGYDDKYLKDQGALYYEISRRWWKLLCAQDAIRHHGEYHKSAWDAYKTMIRQKSESGDFR